MCSYVVEEAVKAVPRLLKNIVILKGKLSHPEGHLFGLLLVILNAKSRSVLRVRAVLSYNPAACAVSLEKDWFEFEKFLYGGRLSEGSLPTESLEIEQAVAGHLRSSAGAGIFDARTSGVEAVEEELREVLKRLLRSTSLELKLRKDVLDMGQFHSLRSAPAVEGERPSSGPSLGPRPDEMLILKAVLDEDCNGVAVGDLRAGDLVASRIVDQRDIAQYLAKLFGGYSEKGPVPIMAPVEAIEVSGGGVSLVRVRFSAGVCGDAEVLASSLLRVQRGAVGGKKLSWWQRFFGSKEDSLR
jgi:hypothetical protein